MRGGSDGDVQGILYLDLPIVFAILQADQRYLRMACLSGVLMMALALATSSFATSVAHLIVTQGILYGIGGSISYSTCLILIEEWFDKRKGFAFGIMLVSSVDLFGGGIGMNNDIIGRHWLWRHDSPDCHRTAARPVRFPDHSPGIQRCDSRSVGAIRLLYAATTSCFASSIVEANQHQVHEDAYIRAALALQHHPRSRVLPTVNLSPQLCQVDWSVTKCGCAGRRRLQCRIGPWMRVDGIYY